MPQDKTSPESSPSREEVDGSPTKKKQKRNKPTLSCSECVERKTKCDRGRPVCGACQKRNTSCTYSQIADLIASNNGPNSTKSSKARKARQSIATISSSNAPSPAALPTPISSTYQRSTSASSSHSSPFLLSNVPHSKQCTASVFGISAEHPFANYWTTQGGVPEVVGVLPNKEHADLLVAKYFEAVDPVYPLLHKTQFYTEYDRFWRQPTTEKQRADASMLALHFAVYAMGAQFTQMESEQQKAQIAEFYVSAAHQSLRLVPFLSKTSVKSIQAMVLMSYFLMNDNKAADAWAFGGILIRQAYAMGLNRDPEVINPHLRPLEKHQRRKLWQAIYFQDTFLTVLLKLPPITSFADVTVNSLTEEPVDTGLSLANLTTSDAAVPSMPPANPMSISAIAPQESAPTVPIVTNPSASNDIAYIRTMWQLADLVQTTVCIPRALSRPISNSPKHRQQLLSAYQSLYASAPSNLSNLDRQAFANLCMNNSRQARQSLFFKSNYWHCVMLIELEDNEAVGIGCETRGALDAGRFALGSFFDFWDYIRMDAGVWWVFQHRAFQEALTMANLLSAIQIPPPILLNSAQQNLDPVLVEAKKDVQRALDILEHVGSAAPEMQKTRTEVLRAAFEAIPW